MHESPRNLNPPEHWEFSAGERTSQPRDIRTFAQATQVSPEGALARPSSPLAAKASSEGSLLADPSLLSAFSPVFRRPDTATSALRFLRSYRFEYSKVDSGPRVLPGLARCGIRGTGDRQ